MRARIVYEEKTKERLERDRKRQQMRQRRSSQPSVTDKGETISIDNVEEVEVFNPEVQRMLSSLKKNEEWESEIMTTDYLGRPMEIIKPTKIINKPTSIRSHHRGLSYSII